MPSEKKIILMGSPEFSIPAFEEIFSKFSSLVIGVISQPDKPKGRSKTPTPTPVSEWAIRHQIPVWTPATKTELAEKVQELAPDIIVVIAYGMILPNSVTDQFYCINVHGSLLPKYRGPSPIHAALLNQDVDTGISLIRITEKMDAGPVLLDFRTLINEHDNFQSIHDRLAVLGADACCAAISAYLDGSPLPEDAQEDALATYCRKIRSEDMQLLPTETALQWMAKIRAFSPTPGAYVIQDTQRIKITRAQLTPVNKLEILEVKPEGKGIMPYSAYLLGHPKGIELC